MWFGAVRITNVKTSCGLVCGVVCGVVQCRVEYKRTNTLLSGVWCGVVCGVVQCSAEHKRTNTLWCGVVCGTQTYKHPVVRCGVWCGAVQNAEPQMQKSLFVVMPNRNNTNVHTHTLKNSTTDT